MTDDEGKPTKEEIESLEKSVIQFYKNSRKVITEMREIFLKLGSPHIANNLEAVVGAMDIDLTNYDKQKAEEKAKEEKKDNAQ
ncbi:MAG: hypothetical protein EHM34_00205 [Nitrosopumilales archaeon]|nr:MAG: hypothetical protein EHM34_00205 [Nitrosopumilales archaeon]